MLQVYLMLVDPQILPITLISKDKTISIIMPVCNLYLSPKKRKISESSKQCLIVFLPELTLFHNFLATANMQK